MGTGFLPYEYLDDSAVEKLELARHLITSYIAARGGFKQLGILRSEQNLQGDYAEWLAAELLGLQLVSSTVQKDFDATDKDGRSCQVKSRVVENLGQNISFDTRSDAEFDYPVGVFFSPAFELLGVIRVPFEVVRELGSQIQTSLSFHWNRRAANDPRVEKLLWRTDMEGSHWVKERGWPRA